MRPGYDITIPPTPKDMEHPQSHERLRPYRGTETVQAYLKKRKIGSSVQGDGHRIKGNYKGLQFMVETGGNSGDHLRVSVVSKSDGRKIEKAKNEFQTVMLNFPVWLCTKESQRTH